MIRLFRVYVPVGVLTLLLTEMGLISCCFWAAAYLFIYPDPTIYLLYDGGVARLAGAVGTLLFAMHLQDLYSQVVCGRVLLIQKMCVAAGLMFLLQGFVDYVSIRMRAPIRVLIPGGMFAIIAISGLRPYYSKALRMIAMQRVLFVGRSPLIDEAAEHLHRSPELGQTIAGYVDDCEVDTPRKYGKVLAPVSRLAEVAEAVKPDCIVVGMQERRGHAPMAALLDLRLAGYSIEEDAAFFERICGRVSCERLRPSQLIFSGEFSVRRTPFMAAFDFGVALFGIILTCPIMLVIAVLIRVTSRGAALYKQSRVGQQGVTFTLYKFRSMYVDAESRTGAVWSVANDPRITPVGRIIRKLRMDELPQLFNVLCGQMSLVGPRPERPEFVKVLSEKIPYYRKRHAVKPGITGWAQINYKYGDTFEDSMRKLEYDLYYIKHMSQSLNNYIIFATAKTIMLQRGAQ